MDNILVYCELDGSRVAEVSLELLSKGRELADTLGVSLEAVALGENLASVAEQVCPYFTTSLYNLTKEHEIELASLDSFVIVICTEGEGTIIDNNGEEMKIRQGESILVPATATSLKVVPNKNMKILTSWI